MKDALTLAGDHLLRVLSPQHHFIPFYEFHINERMQAWAWMRGASHNIPRWIDAMLRLEAVTGYAIPAEAEAVMIENLRLMFDNPDHLCLYPMDETVLPAEAADSLLEYHSTREGPLALTQMIVRRNSEWAAVEEAARQLARLVESFGTRKKDVRTEHHDPPAHHGPALGSTTDG